MSNNKPASPTTLITNFKQTLKNYKCYIYNNCKYTGEIYN